MSHIFISYSRKHIDFTQKIVDALAANHLDTWIDWKSVPKGEDLKGMLRNGCRFEEWNVGMLCLKDKLANAERLVWK